MRVNVKLFAILRERAGASEVVLVLRPGATVADASAALVEKFPQLQSFLPRAAYAVNESYTSGDVVLNEGDELAFIPPVSGGAPADDWIQLHEEPIDVGPVVAFVTAAGAGGIDVFIGTTRQETSDAGRRLVALDYEAYGTMALKQMRDLATRVRAQWPIVRLAILHRVGRVGVGGASVTIAVSAPHRAQAFEA